MKNKFFFLSVVIAWGKKNKKKNEKYTCGQKQRKETQCIAHGKEQFYEGASGTGSIAQIRSTSTMGMAHGTSRPPMNRRQGPSRAKRQCTHMHH